MAPSKIDRTCDRERYLAWEAFVARYLFNLFVEFIHGMLLKYLAIRIFDYSALFVPHSIDFICLALTIFFVPGNAMFHRDSFEAMSRRDHPWLQTDREISLDFASSEQSPSFGRFTESKKRHSIFEPTDTFHEPKEWYSSSATKKEPREDKSFKKAVSPFYTITEKDSQKYRDIVLKSGVPYCQEIKSKRANDEAKDTTVCYKCKNPKNGATYEQCSYASQPLTASSGVQEVVATPTGFRARRSNSEEALSDLKRSESYQKRDSPYRFSEKLFSEATDELPARYGNKDEKCEKIVKDSMVCMVCEDTKSNGKYEQCSYFRRPNEKKYAYSKSSSFKNPEKRGKEDTERSDREHSESKPVRERANIEKEDTSQGSKESSNCQRVEKDSKTCTVCKDPDTGANYEKCSYTYQPDDKVYKFSRSKSFGSPSGSSKEGASYRGDASEQSPRSQRDEYISDYTIPESYYEKRQSPRASSYFEDAESGYRRAAVKDTESVPEEDESSGYEKSRSESERIAKSIEPGNCEEVKRDSMVCRVCKDPKTGSNSEQCSYKSQPTDKSFAYTRSKSFGSPTKDESREGTEVKESREPSFKEGYGFSNDKETHGTQSDAKHGYRGYPKSSETRSETKEESTTKTAPKKIEGDFYDAFKKKAEIQKVLQEFQTEDRSNCKKLMRDKMTCYQCTDEKGFQKEECAFVTVGAPGEDKEDYKESKDHRMEPAKKVSRSTIVDKRVDDVALDTVASASENAYSKKERPKNSEEKEDFKEAEAYEYVAETSPVFDKVLGFTLPAYMLSTSEQEEEFDRVASGPEIRRECRVREKRRLQGLGQLGITRLRVTGDYGVQSILEMMGSGARRDCENQDN
ncbi:uncharacterized protein LOC143144555 [Ptiloglossa arizonensis]|uniref:uncharacterized protein LOC143144555 n=1 Tax=Ptiloglossa arizonensis TaxID=3350558 RepID=UPI003FA0167D